MSLSLCTSFCCRPSLTVSVILRLSLSPFLSHFVSFCVSVYAFKLTNRKTSLWPPHQPSESGLCVCVAGVFNLRMMWKSEPQEQP